MKISIKSNDEIEKMRIAGKLAAEVLEMITPHVVPGISTGELDNMCYEHIINKQNAIPANVGYKGYEKTICSSLNQVICHGIPSNERILKDGDILNIDVTVIKDGWHGDTSKMFLVGKCAPHNERSPAAPPTASAQPSGSAGPARSPRCARRCPVRRRQR